jgi:preprotein translocase subunit SecE
MAFYEKFEIYNKVSKFLKEVQSESKRISWPNREYLTAATIVVIICIFTIAVFMGGIDFLFAILFRYLEKLVKG